MLVDIIYSVWGGVPSYSRSLALCGGFMYKDSMRCAERMVFFYDN